MEKKVEANCPQCPKHCSRDALNCGRGRAYFGIETSEDTHEEGRGGHGGHGSRFAELEKLEPEQMTLAQLLIRCGFIAGKKLSHQGEGADIISGLTDEDRENVQESLVKLLKAWKAEFHS